MSKYYFSIKSSSFYEIDKDKTLINFSPVRKEFFLEETENERVIPISKENYDIFKELDEKLEETDKEVNAYFKAKGYTDKEITNLDYMSIVKGHPLRLKMQDLYDKAFTLLKEVFECNTNEMLALMGYEKVIKLEFSKEDDKEAKDLFTFLYPPLYQNIEDENGKHYAYISADDFQETKQKLSEKGIRIKSYKTISLENEVAEWNRKATSLSPHKEVAR